MSTTVTTAPRQLYRQYLKNLQYLPDPHVWSVLVPEFKTYLRESKDKHASKALRQLRAAVACHPHALVRVLRYSYGQGGSVRWHLIKNITLSSHYDPAVWSEPPRFPPRTLQPVPPALRPLLNLKRPQPAPTRARTVKPAKVLEREKRRAWELEWDCIGAVPLVIVKGSAKTGWEGKGVPESLRVLAGLEGGGFEIPMPRRQRGDAPPTRNEPVDTRSLQTFENLPASLRAVYPKRRRKGPPPDRYPRPRPAHTRENPKTWRPPTVITPRLLTRVYKRLWDELGWVRQTNAGQWIADTWEECRWWEKK